MSLTLKQTGVWIDPSVVFVLLGQSMYGLSHSKPRRLQWTWLGHAELQFGSWTLYVSTLQMFVLLHFNNQEVLSGFITLQSELTHAWKTEDVRVGTRAVF